MSYESPASRPSRRPDVPLEAALEAAIRLWGVSGDIEELPGDRDRNYRVGVGEDAIVLKITDAPGEELQLSSDALDLLARAGGNLAVGSALKTQAGELWAAIQGADGRSHKAWAVRWLEGVPLAHAGSRAPGLSAQLGEELGRARVALDGWEHPALDRGLKWDLRRGLEVAWAGEESLKLPHERRVVREALAGVEVALAPCASSLRVGVIHGDANDHNILVGECDPAAGPCGLLDVGDIDRSWILAEVSIAAAYLMLGEEDPIAALIEFVTGYHRTDPIPKQELGLVFDLAKLRLCVSVVVAAEQRAEEPENEYLSVTSQSAVALLAVLQRIDRGAVHAQLASACGLELCAPVTLESEALLGRRRASLGPNLSISYEEPLEVVRGEGRYLFEPCGRSYLDAVNNVPQVGHCHPRVVERASAQMATLNTNTRYLSDVRMSFVERLLSTLPPALEVVYLVNSGSEANELARRLVKAHVGEGDWVVLDAGYHGNTDALVELSPYKFGGAGGAGCPEGVLVAELPDRHRGRWGYEVDDAGKRYAEDVLRLLDESAARGRFAAAFIAESIPGCGGQLVLPDGYLAACYAAVHSKGGLAIADEVQVGCGRVGSHWWAFETQGVVPDIVTIGKPLGGGHPIGAVVTTRAVADSFDSGMEYFNTFGGNPVSCAIADEVLRVIEDEGLRENALKTGAAMLEGLAELSSRHEGIGDVRGLGLYLGIACVEDRASKCPAPGLASAVVEGMRARGVLLSTDGMDHDVVKMKPPLVFGPSDAVHVLCMLDEAFEDAK